MINDNVFEFIKSRVEKLTELGVDVSNLELDHFGYQTSSKKDYEKEREDSKKIGELKAESIVGERRVAIYELKCPIQFGNFLLSGFELIEPMPNQKTTSYLEHFEFVIQESFDDFMKKYPNIDWELRAKDRKVFPKIGIIFEDKTRVLFHPQNILKEIPR